MSYWTRRKQAASERGRARAKRRWELDAQRRARRAAMAPIKFTGRIVKRIIIIEEEVRAKEITIYDFDTFRDMKRKLRSVLTLKT